MAEDVLKIGSKLRVSKWHTWKCGWRRGTVAVRLNARRGREAAVLGPAERLRARRRGAGLEVGALGNGKSKDSKCI